MAKLEKTVNESDTVSSGKKVKIKTIETKKESVTHTFKVTGVVEAVDFAYVTPEMNGQIQSIAVKEGDRVNKGQLLAKLNDKVMQNTKKELELALDLATTMYEKQKSLYEQGVGKELDYLTAKNQKESLEAKIKTLDSQISMSRIVAPFSGIVDKIYRKEGELAAPGQQFIDLVNLDKFEVEADVSEKYIPYIQKGAPVTVSFSAFPDIIQKTSINRTGNVINPANRTFIVEVVMNNVGGKIKPNMTADLTLSDYSGTDILVPSEAVKTDKKGQFVFVVTQKDGKSIAEKRYIKSDKHVDTQSIVSEGLSEKERVIVQGYNLVTNGTEVVE